MVAGWAAPPRRPILFHPLADSFALGGGHGAAATACASGGLIAATSLLIVSLYRHWSRSAEARGRRVGWPLVPERFLPGAPGHQRGHSGGCRMIRFVLPLGECSTGFGSNSSVAEVAPGFHDDPRAKVCSHRRPHCPISPKPFYSSRITSVLISTGEGIHRAVRTDGAACWGRSMVMATCGTFDYTFVVPEGPRTGSRDMRGALRGPIEGEQERLLDHAPQLQTVDYQRGNSQLHSRITLTATGKKHAIASSFSFTVDRELIALGPIR